MTQEQYNQLLPLVHKSSFYPREVDLMFLIFEQLEGWNPGCKTCPSNITFVKERLLPKVLAFENERNITPAPQQIKKKAATAKKIETEIKTKKKL